MYMFNLAICLSVIVDLITSISCSLVKFSNKVILLCLALNLSLGIDSFTLLSTFIAFGTYSLRNTIFFSSIDKRLKLCLKLRF